MTHTDSIVDVAPDLADEWAVTDSDWNWYLENMHDDFAENCLW